MVVLSYCLVPPQAQMIQKESITFALDFILPLITQSVLVASSLEAG